jgi:hypothetical protein
MTDEPKSRAFDATYKPTKTMAELAREFPDNPGIKSMAEREAHLIVRPWATSSQTFGPCSNQELLELREKFFNARHRPGNRFVSILLLVGSILFIVGIADLLRRMTWITGCMLGVGGIAVWFWIRQDRNIKFLDQARAEIAREISARGL